MITQQEDTRYEYFAFISYKREDEKWAKWLQRKLEYYKLPSSVRKDNPDLPEKIRPVFKDTTDLEPGVLAQKIQDALCSSKFLIVICSPRSANSVWVRKEVKSFIDSGRAGDIIPFIIGGTPNAADPEEECFPEGLRQLAGDQELLGVNINEMGREAAAIKVVARMFGLRFDTLWQRYEKDKRRNRFALFFAVFIFGLLCLGVGLHISHQNLQLEDANKSLKEERDRANSEKNRAEKANTDLKFANDSINRVNSRITSLILDLQESNDEIIRQKLEVEKFNQALIESNANLTLKEAYNLLEDGEFIKAGMLAKSIHPLINDKYPDLPGYEQFFRQLSDSLLWGYNGPVILSKHDKQFMCSNISSAGDYILSGSNDATARIWSMQSGEEISSKRMAHPATVSQCCVSPNGKYIATSTLYEDSIRIWDVSKDISYLYCKSAGRNPLFINDSIVGFSSKGVDSFGFGSDSFVILNLNTKEERVLDNLIYYNDINDKLISIKSNNDVSRNNDATDIANYAIYIMDMKNSSIHDFTLPDVKLQSIKTSGDGKYLFLKYSCGSKGIMYKYDKIAIINLDSHELLPNVLSCEVPYSITDYSYYSDGESEYIAYIELNNDMCLKLWNMYTGTQQDCKPLNERLTSVSTNLLTRQIFLGTKDGHGYFINPTHDEGGKFVLVADRAPDYRPSSIIHGDYYEIIESTDYTDSDTIIQKNNHDEIVKKYILPICNAEIFETPANTFISTYDGEYVTYVYADTLVEKLPYQIKGAGKAHPWIVSPTGIYDYTAHKQVSVFNGKGFHSFFDNDKMLIKSEGSDICIVETLHPELPIASRYCDFSIHEVLPDEQNNRMFILDTHNNVHIVDLTTLQTIYSFKLLSNDEGLISLMWYDTDTHRLYYKYRLNDYWNPDNIFEFIKGIFQYRYVEIPPYKYLLNNILNSLPISGIN